MAYDEALCEFLMLDGTIERALKAGRKIVSTSFIIPYPPGFPILVPGQVVSPEILTFLKALDVKEIHGYRPELGLRVFTDTALGTGSDSRVPADGGRRVKAATKSDGTVAERITK
jgi:arginine decarboxylase